MLPKNVFRLILGIIINLISFLTLLLGFVFFSSLTAQNFNSNNFVDRDIVEAETSEHSSGMNYLFYNRQDYGSESQFGFYNVFFNVGGVLMGRFNYPASVFDVDYAKQGKASFPEAAGFFSVT